MTKQVTLIPDEVFTVKMPITYVEDTDYSKKTVAKHWSKIGCSFDTQAETSGKTLQKLLIAYFMGIQGIRLDRTSLEYLVRNHFLDDGYGKREITEAAKCFLYQQITTSANGAFVPSCVRDLEFYRELDQRDTVKWIEKRMRRLNGEQSPMEKLISTAKKLPKAAYRFVQERVGMPTAGPLLDYSRNGKTITLELNPPQIALPEIRKGEGGKVHMSWPTLNNGSNLLEAPKEAPKQEETKEQPKAEAAPKAQPKPPKKKPAAKKTADGKSKPAQAKKPKGPKRDSNGRFVKKDTTGDNRQPDIKVRGPGGSSGGGTGC